MRVRIGKRASLRRGLGAGSTQKQSFLPAEWHAQRASWVRLPVIHRTRLTRIAPAREPTEDACRSFAGRREKPQEYASSFLVADAPHPHAGPAGKGHSSSRLPIFRMRGRIGEPLETALPTGSAKPPGSGTGIPVRFGRKPVGTGQIQI